MTSILLLANLLFGLRMLPTTPANLRPQPGLVSPCCDAAMRAGWSGPRPFAADAPDANEMTPEAVHQRRNRFVSLVKMGSFDRFDESRQEAIFKRGDPAHSVHEPGPLEDEAIASAAREALAMEYGKLGIRPHLTCTAGKLFLDHLPDDPVTAASAMDGLLALDGVLTVTAALPLCLRLP